MRVLVLSGCLPHAIAAHEAANSVCFHIVRELAALDGWQVEMLCVGTHDVAWPHAAMPQKDELQALGVQFLPNLIVSHQKVEGRGWSQLPHVLRADPDYLCRGAEHSARLAAHIAGHCPDLILTVWSELATAMAHRLPYPVFAYYGNPDPKTAAALRYQSRRYDGAPSGPLKHLRIAYQEFVARRAETAHLHVMRHMAGTVNVAANDAQYYVAHGVPNAAYLRNIWGVLREDWELARDQVEVARPLKIIGNVGGLHATGNTLGLQILGERIVPELRRLLGADAFEVHICGGGRPTEYVARLLDDPNIKVRGFVPDIDAEILSAPVFLVANNWNPRFRVGNTRFLHAWSLGACCIAFRGCAEAMPELVHEENVLLGDTPEQVAQSIARVARDPALRRRIGRRGYETVSTLFSPRVVVADLAARLMRIAVPRT